MQINKYTNYWIQEAGNYALLHLSYVHSEFSLEFTIYSAQ